MKSSHVLLALFAALIITPVAHGQDSATNQDEQQTEIKNKKGHEVATVSEELAEIPLRLEVLLSEFDGTHKVSSLPYSINILGTAIHDRRPRSASLRYGIKIPVGEGNQIQYQSIGTNIDCTAIQREDGAYRLDLRVSRQSLSSADSASGEASWKPGSSGPTPLPVLRSFDDEFTVVARLGQTVEGTSAADPVTGHILKIEVTLTAAK